MMKLVCLFFLCVLLFLGPSSFGEISVEEFKKIRAIVKEEVGGSEARLRVEIAAAEKRAMAHATQEAEKITVRMDVTDRQREAQFNSVDKNFGYLYMLFAALLALIGLPLFRERKKEREQDAKLEAQQKQLEAQQQRIEAQERELAAMRAELAALKQQPTPHAEQPQT